MDLVGSCGLLTAQLDGSSEKRLEAKKVKVRFRVTAHVLYEPALSDFIGRMNPPFPLSPLFHFFFLFPLSFQVVRYRLLSGFQKPSKLARSPHGCTWLSGQAGATRATQATTQGTAVSQPVRSLFSLKPVVFSGLCLRCTHGTTDVSKTPEFGPRL